MNIDATYFDGEIMWIMFTWPGHERACISNNEDGTYTVFIPSGIDKEKRIELALHELEHIKRGDLYAKGDVEQVEATIDLRD